MPVLFAPQTHHVATQNAVPEGRRLFAQNLPMQPHKCEFYFFLNFEQINEIFDFTQIIDMNELFTWVCRSCRQNIEKFSAFQNMLHKNLATFETRFREEQQLNSNWNDDPQQQQRQVVNVRFGDLEDDNEDDLSDLDHFELGQPASLASSDSGNQSEDSQLPEDCALGDSRKGLRIE